MTDKPEHYDNSKGSLYQFCDNQNLNSYEFDIIKRVMRCRKKGNFREDLEKTKFLIDLYLSEYKELRKPLEYIKIEPVITPAAIDKYSGRFDTEIKMINNSFGVDIRTKYRGRRIVYARFIFMEYVKSNNKIPIREIGNALGFTHATILSGLKQYDKLLKESYEFQQMVKVFSKEIKNIKNDGN